MKAAIAALDVVIGTGAGVVANLAAFAAAQSAYSAVDAVDGDIDAAEDAEEATYAAAYIDAGLNLETLVSAHLWNEGVNPD